MASLNGKSILVIDDAADARLLARKILEVDGATVTEAETIDAGIEAVRAHVPHLIIVDLTLPVKTGFDFLDFRIGEPLVRGIPTIVLSGLNDRESVQKALAMGADDYILKPFRAAQVLQKIRKALRLSSFYIRKVAPGPSSKATFSIAGEITRMSEVGCVIECPIKFAPEEVISLKSEFVRDLGIEALPMRASREGTRFLAAGQYVTEVGFVGIDRDLAASIRGKLNGK